ncbi:MAG: CoA transferase [Chloroflexi bacterium]|nr:CoA transferase [Chloroflexota bacterium]
MPDLPGPLEGLVIIEIGSFISASLCTKLFADLGATVIKVELPGEGDDSRRYGPFSEDRPDTEASGLFIYLNANKFGVTLDLASVRGREILGHLVAHADALIENATPDSRAARRLGYTTLAEGNPGLVVTSITPFGTWGPYSGYKGYDATAWHGSGLGHAWLGDPAREPLRGAWYHAEHWGAIGAAAATAMALAARDLTGEGQHVDMSIADMLATHIMGYQGVTRYHLTGETYVRTEERSTTGAPVDLVECKDGYVFVMIYEDSQWQRLVRAMGSPEWAIDPLFAGPSWERAKYHDVIRELMEPWLMSHTKDELFAKAGAEHVPMGPLYRADELLRQPHLLARDFFVELEQLGSRTFTMPGAPYRLSETPWRIRRPAPHLGEHNDLIYRGWLGLSTGELLSLHRAGVV